MNPQEIITKVNAIVSPAYLVGGGVRDIIMGKPPKDYDFCTPLTPDEVEERIKAAGRRVYAIGKKFGTIGFKVIDGSETYYVEVTTYRSERYSPNNRKPEVEFVSDLMDDLSRRDFTINAIAYDGHDYTDPFGGRLDILARKIKPVGDGNARVKEDPLRMLRAARFASQLDFDVDPNFVGTMRKSALKITTVSRERWAQELDKLLLSRAPSKGLTILMDSYLMEFIMPEVYLLLSDPDLRAEIYHKLDSAASLDLRWITLLEQSATPFLRPDYHSVLACRKIGSYIAENVAHRLRWSNKQTDAVIQGILHPNHREASSKSSEQTS